MAVTFFSGRGLGDAGLVLAWLVFFVPAASRGESNVDAQVSGSNPDGGVRGIAAPVASIVQVQVEEDRRSARLT